MDKKASDNRTLPSTESYKGVRDFYPQEQFVQTYIIETMGSVAQQFGYEEYSASLLEPSELYRAKSGEEIVNEQTYSFIDRGGRDVTLRPEMTPTVARMVAAKRRELAFPLRWYSIPNVFRYERPQRGRLREHWQLNCDIFGSTELAADIEIISLAHAIMQAFGAKESDFVIKINSRSLLASACKAWGLSDEEQHAFFKLLDRKNKIDTFDEEARAISESIPLPFVLPKDKALSRTLDELKELGVTNVEHDPSVVRGFDYYTGVVFEVFDTSSDNNRSLFGGGRYDNLLDIFGHESVPAVGFGMGDVTMRDFLETHNLLPSYQSLTDLFIATVSPQEITHAQVLAHELRSEGINVAVNVLDKKIGEQFKTADKKKIPFVLVVGKDEIASGQYTLKNLQTKSEEKVARNGIAELIFGQKTDSE